MLIIHETISKRKQLKFKASSSSEKFLRYFLFVGFILKPRGNKNKNLKLSLFLVLALLIHIRYE